MKVITSKPVELKNDDNDEAVPHAITATKSTIPNRILATIRPFLPYTARKYEPNCNNPDHCLHTRLNAAKKNVPARI